RGPPLRWRQRAPNPSAAARAGDLTVGFVRGAINAPISEESVFAGESFRTGGRMGQLISSILLAAALLLPFSAQADDLLVMPYGCRVVGGRPLLTPAPNQSHRIMGAREQRVFRTCSPMNPTLCRQWTIHRFDMDCDGVPSSWASVIANAYPERA